MKLVSRVALVLLLIASCFVGIRAADKPTTIIFVRHAEKAAANAAPMSSDVDLSEAGQKRAACLANSVADATVTAILTTEYKRTQQTAAPLAKKLSLTPMVIKGADMDGLVAEIHKHTGETILVAGHSNTVPAVIKRLGGGDYTIKDDEYDRMFVMTISTGSASVVALRYCQ